MQPHDREVLRTELRKLSHLKTQLDEQDRLIEGLAARSQSWEGASDSLMDVMRRLFQEIEDALPEDRVSFIDNNDLTVLRSQIVSVRSTFSARIGTIHTMLGSPKPSEIQVDQPLGLQTAPTPDKRRVFVVHGRNEELTKAMFEFLRAIDLSPIEWEEAIRMAGEGVPHNRSAVQAAFSNSWAAVVILNGEDLARVGKQFRLPHDQVYETRLTPQARPNVLLELGMAFGLYPQRTVIVECTPTRPLTDIQGHNTIHFKGDIAGRKKLADRLRNAGCAVVTEGREHWLTAGDFPPFSYNPDYGNEPRPERKPDRRDEQITTLEQQVTQLTTENAELKRRIELLQPHVVAGVPKPRHADKRAVSGEPFAGLPRSAADTFDFDPECKTLVLNADASLAMEVKGDHPNILGFTLNVMNRTPDYIDTFQVDVAEANSWNETHHAFLPRNKFNRKPVISGRDLEPMSRTNGEWLIRVVGKGPSKHLTIYNDDSTPLSWPNNDIADVEIWRLTLGSAWSVKPEDRSSMIALPTTYLLIRWDRVNSILQMAEYREPKE
jgi:predicted nucleotide-binding protein